MVEIKLPKYKTNHFQSLMPDQQQQILEWMQKGVVNVFTLNAESTKAWFVMTADNRPALDDIINEFITRRFMMRIRIEPLLVYDSSAFQLPPLILN